jgi:two-component system copper resistance phosphate regulon response regulator CusR
MKILIVEDEPKTGDYLQQGLAESGFVVDLARNGVDGLHLAVTGDHDLLVLDVMLPASTAGRCWRLCAAAARRYRYFF